MPLPENITAYYYSAFEIKYRKKYEIDDKIKFTYVLLKTFFVPLALALRMNDINEYYSFIDGKNKEPLNIINNYFIHNDSFMGEKSSIMKTIFSIIELSISYRKKFENYNINDLLNKLYDFLFSNKYDSYLYGKPEKSYNSDEVLIFSNMIKTEIFGLLSFTPVHSLVFIRR